jgi:hypothetical protein
MQELLKNGDIPKSPLTPLSSPGAIGGHNSNLKIDLSPRPVLWPRRGKYDRPVIRRVVRESAADDHRW